MPCPHYRIMISTSSKSPPTTASAAYQSGERLYDERTHRTKNYDDKRWNAVEWSETNRNAQMARKLHITLPRELSMDDNLKLIREYVQEQMERRIWPCSSALTAPTRLSFPTWKSMSR